MAFRIMKQMCLEARPHSIGMRSITAAALCSTLLVLPMLPQQKPAEEIPPPISVSVDVVNILASVRDRHNALVPNLTKDNFTLFEDGKQQTIKYFSKETDLPLTIGMLIDVSGSQRNLIQVEREAATQFFSSVLHKKDVAFL